jgi:cell division protein FtsB
MKPGTRILFSFYISFIVYSSISLIWGAAGVVQTSMLEAYKKKLEQNTIELSEISSNLDLEFKRLRTDKELISLKARDLGFFREGEGEIVIKGYESNSINFLVGSYYKRFSSEVINKFSLRIFSGIMGILFFLVLTVFRGKLPNERGRSSIN